MTASVSIRNLTRTFATFKALDDVWLDIAAGEFIVLLGPSGCGKTTLLSILGGFLTPTSGTVKIGDRDMAGVPPARRPTTTMFQDYALFPHMRLIDNVGFGLRMRGMDRASREAKAASFLDLVGLKSSARKKPHELSGGQRQRVALARALAVDPDVLLLDEPLGALDLKLRRQMQDELKALQKRVGTTFVHVTHDQEEAMAIADRIVVMNRGRVEDFGPPSDIYMRPKSIFAAGFMGEVNFLDGRVGRVDCDSAEVETGIGPIVLPIANFTIARPQAGARVTICIRPEHFRAVDQRAVAGLSEAVVSDVSFFGTHYRCHLVPVASPEKRFVAHLPPTATIAPCDRIALSFDPAGVTALPETREA